MSACSSARPANGTGGPDGSHSPGADGGDSDGGEPEPDGAVPDAGSPDTTCPTPSSPFAVDLPPPPAAHTTRRRAAVQVVAGTVRAYSSDFYQNGSFYNASFVQHARGATGWSQSSIAGGGIGSSVARSMATSHGPDACVAWSYDYTGELHLQCASLPDRTLAPRITGSLSLAEHAGHKHLVYQAPGGL
ncbi:MAG TPA: hypothetical protein VK427_22105, partial [Kofleriaceae bacterium]|nr:hypothetical protein [Kofleriaceae bacterium]